MIVIQCKLARKALSWTMEDLAKKSGTAKYTVFRFENGYNTRERTVNDLKRTFEQHGIKFLDNGEGPGIKILRGSKAGKTLLAEDIQEN